LAKLYLYLAVGGGLGGRHESFARFFAFPSLKRVLLLVDFDWPELSFLLSLSTTGGLSRRFFRGAKSAMSTSSSSLLDDMLAESELVTAGMPFLTTRLLELCELMPDMLVSDEKDENEVLTGFFGLGAGICDGAGIDGLERLAGDGISTASTTRTLVGVDFKDDRTGVRPELSGGIFCASSISAKCFLGDFRVGVECPDSSISSSGVCSRNLLGEVEMSLRGRPRPRFTVLTPFCDLFPGDACAEPFAGDSVLSRVLARDELEDATIISSSSS
jgi:hypothetical protein